jgi:Holliday junction resolvase RusA-like endonuclease
MTLRYSIPWPPDSGNHKNARGKYGQIYTKKRMTRWAQDAILVSPAPSFAIPPDAKIKLFCRYFPKDKRKRDTDNAMKPVRDLLEKILGVNDRRFLVYDMDLPSPDKENPRIEVEVEIE